LFGWVGWLVGSRVALSAGPRAWSVCPRSITVF
jgi:hypothetical protein